MKKISIKLMKYRIRFLRKIIAIIGLSAFISSCGQQSDNVETPEVSDTIVIENEPVEQDVIQDTIAETISVPEKQKEPLKPATKPEKPPVDYPVTKYGLPVDLDNDNNYQTKYGAPVPENKM
jgi:hypothetical protein